MNEVKTVIGSSGNSLQDPQAVLIRVVTRVLLLVPWDEKGLFCVRSLLGQDNLTSFKEAFYYEMGRID